MFDDLIDDILKDLEKATGKVNNQLVAEISKFVKELSLDANGNIKPTVSNIKIIKRISQRIEGVIINNPEYKGAVKDVLKGFNEVTTINEKLTKETFGSVNLPASLSDIKELSKEQMLSDLIGTGVKENVVSKIETVLTDSVKSGNSFQKMNEQLLNLLKGDENVNPKLTSYTKQMTIDSIYQYSGNYDKLTAMAYKTKWFQYIGSLVRDSRPLCEHLVNKRFIHESELTGIVNGRIDGKQVSTAGMISGTNEENFQTFRGGYNCRHRMIAVPESKVPKELREKFKEKKIKDWMTENKQSVIETIKDEIRYTDIKLKDISEVLVKSDKAFNEALKKVQADKWFTKEEKAFNMVLKKVVSNTTTANMKYDDKFWTMIENQIRNQKRG
jgi:hypothetical protein